MKTVRCKRDDLLNAMRKNQGNHRSEFLKAQQGWRQVLIEELDRRQADARAGRRVEAFFNVPEPEDHTGDYDRVIRMLEMSVEDEIEIDEQHFSWYVLDDWSWKAHWSVSNAAYVTKAGG